MLKQTYRFLTTSVLADNVRIERSRLNDIKGRKYDPFIKRLVPDLSHPSGWYEWSPVQFAMFLLLTDFVSCGMKSPLAAKIACRVMEAHEREPEVESWAIVVTQNGNVSTLPYDQAELRTGFISGSRLSFALVVDLRTYNDRVDTAIATAKPFGGQDAE